VRCARFLDKKTPESTHDSQQTKKAIPPPEFKAQAIELLAIGRPVAELADKGIICDAARVRRIMEERGPHAIVVEIEARNRGSHPLRAATCESGLDTSCASLRAGFILGGPLSGRCLN
jgi:hypothetical protein